MSTRTKTTLSTLQTRKREGVKITVLTCYDAAIARLIESAELDCILVGDTYAEVCLGHASTLPATMDQMITVTSAVRRGAPHVYLIGDMPYLSYQASETEAIHNAGRFMAEAGCDCVKVEVDRRLLGTVEAMCTASIPVMAHLGLRPQSVHSIGGYKVQGRDAESARRLIEDAKLMEQAGAVALLLEAVPVELGRIISQGTALPVIGCVSGAETDGQVVVLHDMLGLGAGHPPRAVRTYAKLNDALVQAFRAYAKDVREARFPLEEFSTRMTAEALGKLQHPPDAEAPPLDA
ncbi:MAG: 3-methyl-2-oxobutanoate hydroxymethyltransferase [Phycisphaerales bacterium]|nr:3-methyl-2-oxobutanoate hydroxymethyltransferase [Phycisphaerales bacterium]